MLVKGVPVIATAYDDGPLSFNLMMKTNMVMQVHQIHFTEYV